ncbi:hypothetical protein Hanom_Chr10g00964481 [Helianthus anomalus]
MLHEWGWSGYKTKPPKIKSTTLFSTFNFFFVGLFSLMANLGLIFGVRLFGFFFFFFFFCFCHCLYFGA